MVTPNYEAAESILCAFAGLDVGEHGQETPLRFLRMLDELTQCKGGTDIQHFESCVKWKTFKNEGMDEMIVQRDIDFVSLCNHHVIPFIGVAHIAYVPDDTICGLSKLSRVVKHFARQLQVQERMTHQIANFLETRLKPRGLAVMVEAQHLCMTIRGTQAKDTLTTTSSMSGVFADHSRTAKAEFLQIVKGAR